MNSASTSPLTVIVKLIANHFPDSNLSQWICQGIMKNTPLNKSTALEWMLENESESVNMSLNIFYIYV